MVNIRKFCISGGLFCGFRTYVDLDQSNNINSVITNVTANLKKHLDTMTSLVEKIDKINYHIHDYSFEDMLLSNSTHIFYVCDHC